MSDDSNALALRVSEAAETVSDAELVALLTGSTPELSETALAAVGGIRELGRLDAGTLAAAGFTAKASARLLAAFATARRSQAASAPTRLRYAPEVYAYFRPKLGHLMHEEFHVACLNTRNRLLRAARVSVGGFASCAVLPREVFAPALSCGATSIILVHNHPSGDPEPSSDDISLTARLIHAGKVMGIAVADHVVVAADGFASLAAMGHMGS